MKKKFGFHIVKEKKDPTEGIADDIMDELQDSQNPMREMELKIKAHRYRFFRRVVIVAVSVVVVTAGVGLFLKYQTNENVAVTATYEKKKGKTETGRYEMDFSQWKELKKGEKIELKIDAAGFAEVNQK